MYTISKIYDDLIKYGNSKVYLEFVKYSNINEVVEFKIQDDKLIINTAVEFYDSVNWDGININDNANIMKKIEINTYKDDEIYNHPYLQKLLIKLLFSKTYVKADVSLIKEKSTNALYDFEDYINQIFKCDLHKLVSQIKLKRDYFQRLDSLIAEVDIPRKETSIEALKMNIELSKLDEKLIDLIIIYKRLEYYKNDDNKSNNSLSLSKKRR